MEKKEPKKQALFKLKESVKHQLQKTAEEEGVPMVGVVRRALDLYFRRREREFDEREKILDTIEHIGDLFTAQKEINQSFETSLEKLESEIEGIEKMKSLKERVENYA